jgi:hypothetical protein
MDVYTVTTPARSTRSMVWPWVICKILGDDLRVSDGYFSGLIDIRKQGGYIDVWYILVFWYDHGWSIPTNPGEETIPGRSKVCLRWKVGMRIRQRSSRKRHFTKLCPTIRDDQPSVLVFVISIHFIRSNFLFPIVSRMLYVDSFRCW